MGCCGSEQAVTAGGVNGVVHQVQHLPPRSVRWFTEGYGQSRHSIAAVALCGSDQPCDRCLVARSSGLDSLGQTFSSHDSCPQGSDACSLRWNHLPGESCLAGARCLMTAFQSAVEVAARLKLQAFSWHWKSLQKKVPGCSPVESAFRFFPYE